MILVECCTPASVNDVWYSMSTGPQLYSYGYSTDTVSGPSPFRSQVYIWYSGIELKTPHVLMFLTIPWKIVDQVNDRGQGDRKGDRQTYSSTTNDQ